MTELEAVVLEVERELNSADVKRDHPEIGEDIKVMGLRRDSRIDLTVSCAFVAGWVASRDDYREKKDAARTLVLKAARRVSRLDVSAAINAADDLAGGSIFLTVTGTSAESGDDGEVGRGNRASGLITPYRPMTMEAAAGKNPVTHVGKLYNVLACRMAESIVAEIPGAAPGAECVLLSRVGRPVSDPEMIDVRLTCDSDAAAVAVRDDVARIVASWLGAATRVREELLQETIRLF